VAHRCRRRLRSGRLPTDVADEAQVVALEKAVAARFGRVQILINNAGINLRKPITEFTLEEWNASRPSTSQRVSHVAIVRAAPPRRGYGRIINITSMMSHVSLPAGPLFHEQGRVAGIHEGPGPGTSPRADYGQRISPGPARRNSIGPAESPS